MAAHPAAAPRRAAPRRCAAAAPALMMLPLLLALLALLLAPAPAAAQTAKGLIAPYNIRFRNVTLSEIPNCGDDDVLSGGLIGECLLQGVLAPDEVVVVSFTVAEPPAAGAPADAANPATGTWDVMAQLRTVGGAAALGLVTPAGAPPPALDYAEDMQYESRENGERFIGVSGEFLEKNPGEYTLNITSDSDSPVLFTLQLHTPLATVNLVPEEVAVIAELKQRCCPPTATGQFCTKILPAVTSPTRPPEADLCRMPPTNCGPTGRIRQLGLAGAGLDCGALGLPPSLANLAELNTLDLAYNRVGGSVAQLAQVVNRIPTLRRLYFRHTNLTGPLDCGLVVNPTLTVVSLSGNTGITGELPACYLNDKTLEELYISGLGLTGDVPDVIPGGSPLRVIFAIGKGAFTNAPALTGAIPSSLTNAADLTFLDVSNNAFAGDVPALPDSLRFFNASANSLTGMPDSFPAGIVFYDVSYNSITGSIPDMPRGLIHLNLAENELSGPLPGFAARRRRRASALRRRALLWTRKDRITVDAGAGTVNPAVPMRDDDGYPQLRFLMADLNHLTGSLPEEWGTEPYNLHTLDLSNNDFSGSLPQKWDLPQLTWLDLSANLFEGSVPASLGEQPSLVHLDLRGNVLGGELGPFADALAGGSDRLVYLDLSDNYFEGPIPESFQDANILNSAANVLLNGVPAKRVLDLSNNSFSGGPFPMWLIEELFMEKDDCGGCEIKVAVNGDDDHLACPTKEEAAAYADTLKRPGAVKTLQAYNFQCDAGNNTQVALLSVLDGSAVGSRERREGKGKPPTAEELGVPTGGNAGRKGKKLPPAAIAGIVVGSVLGAALLAGGAFFALRATQHTRAGWSKERLDGAGNIVAGGGSGRRAGGLPVGAGWGSRSAAVDQAVFGVMPPAREAGVRSPN